MYRSWRTAIFGKVDFRRVCTETNASLLERQFGFWAVELKGTGEFVGAIGIVAPTFEAASTPCIEVGWRLAREHWRKGYATDPFETRCVKLGQQG